MLLNYMILATVSILVTIYTELPYIIMVLHHILGTDDSDMDIKPTIVHVVLSSP